MGFTFFFFLHSPQVIFEEPDQRDFPFLMLHLTRTVPVLFFPDKLMELVH